MNSVTAPARGWSSPVIGMCPPVSTTHSVFGGVVGASVAAAALISAIVFFILNGLST
ncbi:hypothetical protein [Paramylibacter ulvae]|uniref:hypothetical protein n=1 Tax=Paramylibacter ulvae TaxID=1651968 RepID=UPI001E2CC298|nr:hypothetical protein [Amylibacter ulvae]